MCWMTEKASAEAAYKSLFYINILQESTDTTDNQSHL